MKYLCFLLNYTKSGLVAFVLAIGTTVPTQSAAQEASDRTSASFGQMLQKQTSRWCGSRWPPVPAALHWNGYGCWCGLGGGGAPVDRFDAACRAHDQCWAALRNPGEICHGAQEGTLLGYRWQWRNNQVGRWVTMSLTK